MYKNGLKYNDMYFTTIPTSMISVRTESSEDDSAVYFMLDGRRLPELPHVKGVYVSKGKNMS